MSLLQSDAVRVFEKWALGIHHGPEDSMLVTGMNGEVVELDSSLHERRRWQAHDGSVNALRVIEGRVWTGGGDGRVRVWDWTSLQVMAEYGGPKKPVTSFFVHAETLVAQSYERAAFLWPVEDPQATPRKVSKVANLVQTEAGVFGCPKTGSKAADIGPVSTFDLATGSFGLPLYEDGFAAWSLQDVPGRDGIAFGLDLQAYKLDWKAGTRMSLDWHSKSGAPSVLILRDGTEIIFGDGRIYHNETAQDAPIKGLYCAVELHDHRVAFAGADGQVWVFDRGL